MNFSLVAAVDKNFGLGKNNTLVWRLPSDLKHFSEITTTVKNPASMNAVIMGRKTWESLPEKHRPLKNRLNVVLSRENLKLPEGVILASSLDDALEKIGHFAPGAGGGKPSIENIFVIGGGKVYQEAINHPACERIYLTQIDSTFDCDTFFPKIDENRFRITDQSEPMTENKLEFRFLVYEKV